LLEKWGRFRPPFLGILFLPAGFAGGLISNLCGETDRPG